MHDAGSRQFGAKVQLIFGMRKKMLNYFLIQWKD